MRREAAIEGIDRCNQGQVFPEGFDGLARSRPSENPCFSSGIVLLSD